MRTVNYMGWKGELDNELLGLARDDFDVLITLDQKIDIEQILTDEDVAVIILRPGTDDIEALRKLVPEIVECLIDISRGQVVRIPTAK